MIWSYFPLPIPLVTERTSSPSSTTVPANTVEPALLKTAAGSPVMDAWLTLACPKMTVESRGMTLEVRRMIRSPGLMSLTDIRTSSPSSVCTQTWSTCRLIISARSSTDFSWVQSSKMSPICCRKMILPAVPMSPRTKEVPMAAASKTETSIFQDRRDLRPLMK